MGIPAGSDILTPDIVTGIISPIVTNSVLGSLLVLSVGINIWFVRKLLNSYEKNLPLIERISSVLDERLKADNDHSRTRERLADAVVALEKRIESEGQQNRERWLNLWTSTKSREGP
jgi:hypothetical protein